MTAAAPLSDNMRGAGFMIVAMAAFTAGDACMRSVAEMMPLYQSITLRGLVTVPALALIAYLTGGIRISATAAAGRMVGLRTFAEVGATIAFFLALLNLPFATVSAIMQSLPLAVTAGAALFLGEHVGWRRIVAILAGFFGVLLIIRPGPDGVSFWALMALVSVAFVVLRDLSTRRLPASVPSVTVALLASIAVTVCCGLLSLRDPWVAVAPAAWPLLLGAAILVIAGYVFVIRVMRVGDISFTMAFRYTALVWAVLLGWLIFGEFPDAVTLVGAGIVIGSGVFTLLRERVLHLRAARGAVRETQAAPPPTPPA